MIRVEIVLSTKGLQNKIERVFAAFIDVLVSLGFEPQYAILNLEEINAEK